MDTIENIICGIYGFKTSELYNAGRRRRGGDITECLHFIIYFRHYRENVSLRSLARIYGMTDRNVTYIVTKMRYGIANERYYSQRAAFIASMLDKSNGKEKAEKVS